MTTVSPSHISRQLLLVHTHICSTPLFTKFNRLSILLVANSHNLILFRICSIYPPEEASHPPLRLGWTRQRVAGSKCQSENAFKVGGCGGSNIRKLTGTIKADWIQLPVEKYLAALPTLFFCLDAASLNEGLCPGGRPSRGPVGPETQSISTANPTYPVSKPSAGPLGWSRVCGYTG